MNIVDSIRRFFNKKSASSTGKTLEQRRLIGSRFTRFTEWIGATLSKVNLDLDNDLLPTIVKCRDLAKNSPIVRAYLSACQKNIIGQTGFSLQCQVKNPDGTLNQKLNDEVEWAWYNFGKAMHGFLTVDGGMGHNDLDALILRTLIIDGEVFIRVLHPQSNPYGLSFQIIDSASIDFTKRRDFPMGNPKSTAIVLGVEIDAYFRPIAYYIKPGTTVVYQAGIQEKIPAADIIHIFKREFPQQVRGIPPLNASLESLKNLEDFRLAEILAAKVASCAGVFYERNNTQIQGDFINQQEVNDQGEFAKTLEPFMASVVPIGYTAKTLTPNHPNSGYRRVQ